MAYYPYSTFSAFGTDQTSSQASPAWPTQQGQQLQHPQQQSQQQPTFQAIPQQTFYLLSPTTSAPGLSPFSITPKAKAIPVAVEGRDVKSRRFGICKFFNPSKGFGFIEDTHPEELPIAEGDPGPDIFVHFSHIVAAESPFKSLLDGESVEYTLGRSTKGLAAMEVTAPGGGPVKGNPLARSLSTTAPGITSAVLVSPMTLPIPMTASPNPSTGMTFDPYTVHAPTAWALPNHGGHSPNPSTTSFYGVQQPNGATRGGFGGNASLPSPFDRTTGQTATSPWASPTFAVTVGMPLFPGGPRSGHTQQQSLSGISQASSRGSTTTGTLITTFEFPGRPSALPSGLPRFLERDDPYRPAWQKLSQPSFVPQWSPPGGRRGSDEPHRVGNAIVVKEMGRKLNYGEAGEGSQGGESPSKHLIPKGLSTPPLSPAATEFKLRERVQSEDGTRVLYESGDVSGQTTNTTSPESA